MAPNGPKPALFNLFLDFDRWAWNGIVWFWGFSMQAGSGLTVSPLEFLEFKITKYNCFFLILFKINLLFLNSTNHVDL